MIETRPRRARLGASLLFFTNGALLSALLPRLPEIKAAFDLSNSAFGLLVIAFPTGAMVAAGSGGPVVRRFGARRVTAIGSVLLAAALALAGAAPAVWVFALAMFVAGLLDAIVDAAQNVQGVIVEEWTGRSIINSLHALWSLGAALGGLIGAFGAARDIPLSTQMLVNGALWAALALLASRWAATPHDSLVEPAEDAPVDSSGPRLWRLLIPLVVLAICGTLVEDIANNWTVLFLGREAGAPAGIAGLGFTVVIAAQFVGRLLGDPMTDRWGRERVAAAGGVLVALGFVLVIAAPVYAVAFAGFALAGFGCATLVPAASPQPAGCPVSRTAPASLCWGG
ncbi:MFS transporter [Nostocoides veronense]|uniref:MFS transporter n=1 Tax=Nostocoides veronense TaxID=330836 RepID=A0ABN2M1Z4_9MICO